ncbi:ROK family protein [Agromyces atrinae]|uniref:Putative NBD/HSP70 family sugar kinase n=1 Tax=Agromyces atrinae TaxID=592376 RepID=A0A852S140_9MICO|nr:ROK family protein [Agromyces atrinae]NYD67068.1 putative NBD/HSP70 family sugar kinase [Agromyces atrinae]
MTTITESALGNNNELVRRRNLGVILSLVHASGGLSRSTLTRETGLNRSTIGALVGDLAEHGLVEVLTPDSAGTVGRPSPIVSPAPGVVALAVNPEIDAVTIGIVRLGGELVTRVRYPTDAPPTPVEAVRISAAVIDGMRGELQANLVAGIGVAVPGLVRASDGLVRWAPHLGWRDVPFAEMLAEATGYRVVAANDATLGAMAERAFGAARGIDDFIYLNGGASGIGGGIVAGGVPVAGKAGYAGEFGHVRVTGEVNAGGDPEAGALERSVNRAALLAAVGRTDAEADGLEAALLASDDEHVRAEVRRQLDHLSVSLRNAIAVLNPERIVLGGFLASLFAVDPEHLRSRVAAQVLPVADEEAEIVRAELGQGILMIGAAELAFRDLLVDPLGIVARV